ncbi:MAG: efflux RND transporter periplasmic adaptor subunit [Prevotellaceae bacterium]|jgi:HlyD family secretion protein|nr:efflux RND transporter periplasmic adaptor subunit [Prevotellaceae bacterium]
MKKVIKYILWALLAALVVWTFVFLWKKSRPVEKTYNIEEVSAGTIEKRTVATGKVEPRNEILIKPQMSGIIAEIYKEAGDRVKAGDIIAKIKVIPDMVNLNAAESRVEVAQINFAQTQKTYERDQKLFAENVISREEFEKSESKYKNDKAETKAAQDNLSLVRDGISSNRAAGTNTLVRSTVTGTILDVPVKVGNSVIQSNNFNDGTTIASIADMGDMLFVGKMDETEVGKIHAGMPLTITIGALQDKKFDAVLEYVSPKGTEENGAILFQMKAAMTIPADVFVRAGYSANADILLAKADSVLKLSESCIEFSGDTAFVQVLTTETPQAFEKKQVTVGLSDGINIEIKSGVKEKEKVRGTEKMGE